MGPFEHLTEPALRAALQEAATSLHHNLHVVRTLAREVNRRGRAEIKRLVAARSIRLQLEGSY